MFFATAAHPQVRRQAYANAGQSLERFMSETLGTARDHNAHFSQDETSFTLSFDVPGLAKDQLSIAIEGAIVRISNKEGASRKVQVAYELPQEIDTTTSEAKLENGVLTLKLTKLLPVDKSTELAIQ